MELQIYSSEKYDRSNMRYVLFGIVMASILTASIAAKNRAGAILLFFLLWGYFYYSVKNSTPTTMKILDTGLQVDRKIFPRSSLQWFALELDTKWQIIKNIVILARDGHTIHSIHDSNENLQKFVQSLNAYIPMVDKFDQNTREKILRKLKV
jgi:hypothetical protein